MAQIKTKKTSLIILVIIILVGWYIDSEKVNSETNKVKNAANQALQFALKQVQTSNAPRVRIAGGNNTTFYVTDFQNYNTQQKVQEELLYYLKSEKNFPKFKLQSIDIPYNGTTAPISAVVRLNTSIFPWSTKQISASTSMTPILMENKTGPQKYHK